MTWGIVTKAPGEAGNVDVWFYHVKGYCSEAIIIVEDEIVNRGPNDFGPSTRDEVIQRNANTFPVRETPKYLIASIVYGCDGDDCPVGRLPLFKYRDLKWRNGGYLIRHETSVEILEVFPEDRHGRVHGAALIAPRLDYDHATTLGFVDPHDLHQAAKSFPSP